MRNKTQIAVIVLLSLCNLSVAQDTATAERLKETSTSKNLILNQEFVDYINNQLKADNFNQVIIWADSIMASENVTFEHADLTLISNYFSTEGEITLMTESRDTTKTNLPGYNGRTVNVFAKNINKIKFYLPGGHGLPGKPGKDGKNGKRKDAMPKPGGGSHGTPGEDGHPGGNGGTGGNLIVSSLDPTYDIGFRAPGGNGGTGGKGGSGGTSYLPKVSKVISSNKVNEKMIYVIKPRKEKRGEKGKDGGIGKKGKVSKKIIDVDMFNNQIKNFFSSDPIAIEKTGWQIILRTNKDDNKNLEHYLKDHFPTSEGKSVQFNFEK